MRKIDLVTKHPFFCYREANFAPVNEVHENEIRFTVVESHAYRPDSLFSSFTPFQLQHQGFKAQQLILLPNANIGFRHAGALQQSSQWDAELRSTPTTRNR